LAEELSVFTNYVNWQDRSLVTGALRRLLSQGPRAIAQSLTATRSERVRGAWQVAEPEPTEWWVVPGVQQRWHTLISGDPSED
jgi:hypothetical protein